MLLQHPWLSELIKPETISEEDEEEAENDESNTSPTTKQEGDAENTSEIELPPNVVNVEVARWVIQAIERRRQGKMGKKEKPALHAAPLDVMVSPSTEK
jgi:mitogen-activated protein kinase kinase